MMTMTIIDWIWWSAGSLIGLGGIALTIWALFAGRSRGRRRCPKCWYEMTGIEGLRCPECGRTVKRERRLLRTRRRWRVALLGVVVIVAGGGCFFGQRVHQKGWIEATPSIVYIVGLPWLDHDTSFDELLSRISNGELAQWEYWCLVHRCIERLENETDPEQLVDLAQLLSRIEIGGRNLSEDRPCASWALVSEIDGDGAINALVGLLEQDDKDVRLAAIDALGQFTRAASRAMPVLLGQLASEDKEIRGRAELSLGFLFHSREDALSYPYFSVLRFTASLAGAEPVDPSTEERRRAFYLAAGACGLDVDRAIALFRDEIRNSSDTKLKRISILGLALLGDRGPEDLQLILTLAEDDDEFVRRSAVSATSVFPYGADIREVLERGLRDSINVRYSTLSAIGLRGKAAESFISDVERVMNTSRGHELTTAARAFVQIGGDPEIAIDPLLDAVMDESTRRGTGRMSWPGSGLWTLASLGVESESACERLRPLLESTDPKLKADAGYVYVMLGGDQEIGSRAVFEAHNKSMSRETNDAIYRLARSGRMSVAILEEMLDADRPARRAFAAQHLALSGGAAEPALPRLRELVSDPDPDVSKYAEESIRHIERVLADDE